MKVVKDLGFENKPYTSCNPYTIAFVYTKKKPKGFIIKGRLSLVNDYLNEFEEPMIIHKSFWHNGRSMCHVSFKGFKEKIYSSHVYSGDKYISVHYYKKEDTPSLFKHIPVQHVIKRVKRIPRKWMKELNEFC